MKLSKYSFSAFSFFISLFLPLVAFAQSQEFFEAQRKINETAEQIMESPLFGIISYALLAIGLFLVAILLAFFLYMFLKR